MFVFGSVVASNDGVIAQGNYNMACLKQASLLKNHSLEPLEVLFVTFQLQLHFNNCLIKHTWRMGRYSSSQQSLSLAKTDKKKKACLGWLPVPLLPPSPFFSMVAIYFVPKPLLSFIKKSLAPLITKKTFEMWNEFKPTQQCVLKSSDTCNNSSWMCELSYSRQQSANSKAKVNRGHMVQWLDHYFGICGVQV